MQIRDINKLKRKLTKICNDRIIGIIEQMIANESAMKAFQGNEVVTLQPISLELKIILTVEDNVGGPNFSIGSYSSAIDVK